MTICYFGIYNPEYSRSRVLLKGLCENGIEIIECRSTARGIKKYLELINKHRRLGNYDLMIVAFPGYQAMILAKILSRKKIIFDAFTSLYDSLVFDRKTVKRYSLKALYYWLLDWLACCSSDRILLDTNEQIEYFIKKFKIKKEKFIRVFVGSDMVPFPVKKKKHYFLVHFHGSFITLQGVEYIIGAARILEKENIRFRLIGTKIKNEYQSANLRNIEFLDDVSYEELNKYIAAADVCLGIFGITEKAKRVIPNKVYEALAAEKAVITGESPALKELLKDKQNVLCCNLADEKDLAKKILELKNNSILKDEIAHNGLKIFQEKLMPIKIVKDLIRGL